MHKRWPTYDEENTENADKLKSWNRLWQFACICICVCVCVCMYTDVA